MRGVNKTSKLTIAASISLVLIVASLFACCSFAGATLQTWPINQQAANKIQELPLSSERVEQFVRATGDLGTNWQPHQFEAYLNSIERLQQQRRRLDAAASVAASLGETTNGAQYQSPLLHSGDGGLYDTGIQNERALVDEFRSISQLSNPARESRAFKPKIMSTARGFGKRGSTQSPKSQRIMSFRDLIAAAAMNPGATD